MAKQSSESTSPARRAVHRQRNRETIMRRLRAIGEKKGTSLAEILAKTADIIPSALRSPGMIRAIIRMNGVTYPGGSAKKREKTAAWMRSRIRVFGKIAGSIEIDRVTEKGRGDKASPPAEDRTMLDAVAESLGRVIERKEMETALWKAEAQFADALKMARLGRWEYDVGKDLFTFNDHFYAVFHTTAEQAGGYTMSSAEYTERFVHPEDRAVVGIEIRKALEAVDPDFSRQLEHRILYADGGTGHVIVRFFIVKDAGGRTVGTYGVNQDITERKRLEETLEKERKELKLMLDSTPIIVFYKDEEGKFLRVNRAFAQALDIAEKDFVGKTVFDLYSPKIAQAMTDDDREVLLSSRPKLNIVEPYESVDGIRWVQADKVPVIGEKGVATGLIGFAQDITERKLAEERIQAALEEKDVLLREIHHRVKNNMQAMISLVQMRRDSVQDEKTLRFLKELEEQARTMSLVYEQLYRSKDLARVDMASYLNRLLTFVLEAFGGGREIKIDVDVPSVSLEVSQAMPCGLIVNELVTNSLKYAFPRGFTEEPVLRIVLRRTGSACSLTVSDNGVGLPAGLDWETGQTLGLRLVHLLATHQLGGTLEAARGKGTSYTVEFEAGSGR